MIKKKQQSWDINYLIKEIWNSYDLCRNQYISQPNLNLHFSVNICDNIFKFAFYVPGQEKNADDEFVLNFSEDDKKIYEYVCLFFIYKIFEFVNAYWDKENNKIYNLVHLPFLDLTINDDDLMAKVIKLLELNNNNCRNEVYQYLEDLYFEIPKKDRRISNDILLTAEYRRTLSKKLIMGGYYG